MNTTDPTQQLGGAVPGVKAKQSDPFLFDVDTAAAVIVAGAGLLLLAIGVGFRGITA